MKNLYPRTAQEFADHGRHLVMRCAACGKDRTLPAAELVAIGGLDLDVYDAWLELWERLRCPGCGGELDGLSVHNEHVRHFQPSTSAEALAADLELRAFARARDRAEALRAGQPWSPDSGGGRRRRFGIWGR